ncbi:MULTISPECIES: MerR family DNA-binding protein [Gammaproteobacteria]|jgi:MerR family mercuric resistance operon transcriptional regulator|uniref:MerR family transcriptional regulator n=5 Tax=Gammaproteobacteria TaxID=1236 RepID=A0A154QEJ2_9GAMM|nr:MULTISPECIES: MerR family DNA-binding protein [Gammaproteobacteria]KZC15917.1 MerR family transcriptional regulator [Rhodanobacter sp. FW104-R8]KZC22565.1 MerR family transcriptional regulator [Rhodanobacter thiooxydans]KZC26488.1 MerR family transcriptional regulator [Rhodanobacter sp. FW510-T8]KZC30283.1 MerR family transcriptional regulator [Rhodanobacter sp. FW510-R10]MDT0498173.1 MerR family DNA-binding protein [Algiphilus sp. W345]
MTSALTIGRLALAADVHIETVRYYQRVGLLREPERPLGGVRRYEHQDLARLQFIRRAKTMGFTLDEIAGLLHLKGKRACEQTRRMTEHKLLDVRRKLEDLKRLETELMQLADDCAHAPRGEHCPTLNFLHQT